MKNLPSLRLAALDAARGLAMLLVCTSHFIDVYGDKLQQDNLIVMSLLALTKIATPTFVIVSGILLGYFHSKPETFSRLRIHLLDRALFLVTIGHILMASSFVARTGWISAASHWYITDTLGFCLLGGMVVLRYMAVPSARLGFGIFLYAVGWAGWNTWHPENASLILLKSIFLGPDEGSSIIFWFPLLSWFGIYLIGTFVGAWLGAFRRGCLFHAGKILVKLSCIALSIGIFSKVLLMVLQIPSNIYLPLFSYSKIPPGPLYILTFGSAALLLLGSLLMLCESSRYGSSWIAFAQRLGRNSFSAFLTQSFINYTLIFLLVAQASEVKQVWAWLLLISSLIALGWLSVLFERIGLTRMWAIGLPAFLEYVQASHWRSAAVATKK